MTELVEAIRYLGDSFRGGMWALGSMILFSATVRFLGDQLKGR